MIGQNEGSPLVDSAASSSCWPGSRAAQDPDINRLLRKLPPPEKVVTQVAPTKQQADPAAQDPLGQKLIKKLTAGKMADGLNDARKLAARYPASPVAHFLHGVAALARSQNGEAVAALRKSAAAAPQWADPHFALGLAEGQQGRFAAALPHLQKAAQLAPTQAPAFVYLSACLERLDRKQESLKAARRATQLAPQVAATWAQLARAEARLGHRAEALLAVGKAVRLAPKMGTVAMTANVDGLDLNRPLAAIRILQKAIALDPKNSLLKRQLRDFQALAAETQQTLPRLQKAAAKNPASAPAWLQLGLAYQKLERQREANDAFAKAKRLSPAERTASRSSSRRR